MKRLGVLLGLVASFWISCATVPGVRPRVPSPKIGFSLDQLDANGLRGPATGKVALSYEFSIPDTDACRNAVRQIDPGIQFMPGSRGRVGAGKGECLCIGTTGPGFRERLNRLADLPYIKRIIECYFE